MANETLMFGLVEFTQTWIFDKPHIISAFRRYWFWFNANTQVCSKIKRRLCRSCMGSSSLNMSVSIKVQRGLLDRASKVLKSLILLLTMSTSYLPSIVCLSILRHRFNTLSIASKLLSTSTPFSITVAVAIITPASTSKLSNATKFTLSTTAFYFSENPHHGSQLSKSNIHYSRRSPVKNSLSPLTSLRS